MCQAKFLITLLNCYCYISVLSSLQAAAKYKAANLREWEWKWWTSHAHAELVKHADCVSVPCHLNVWWAGIQCASVSNEPSQHCHNTAYCKPPGPAALSVIHAATVSSSHPIIHSRYEDTASFDNTVQWGPLECTFGVQRQTKEQISCQDIVHVV